MPELVPEPEDSKIVAGKIDDDVLSAEDAARLKQPDIRDFPVKDVKEDAEGRDQNPVQSFCDRFATW
jgi:hypothetical protein